MANFFMIKEHPNDGRLMIQVDNTKIELDRNQQETLYKYLKTKMRD